MLENYNVEELQRLASDIGLKVPESATAEQIVRIIVTEEVDTETE